MAPPHFQGSVGGGTSCAQRTSLMLPNNPSKLGFLQNSGYHPNYYLLGFRATCAKDGPASRNLQGPPKASRVVQGLRARTAGAGFGRVRRWPLGLTRRFAAARAQDPPTNPPGRRLKQRGRHFRAGSWFPIKGYIVYVWPTGVAQGRAVPPDVREEPGGADVHLKCLTILVMGEQPKQAGWEFRV